MAVHAKGGTPTGCFSVMTYGNPPRNMVENPVAFTMLYTMNAPEDFVVAHNYLSRCDEMETTIGWAYKCKVERVAAYNTYQFTDYSKYESEYFDEADKRNYRDTHFSLDLKAAFDAGAKCAE